MPKIVAMSSTSIVDVFDGNSVVETIIEYAVSSDGRIPPGNPITDGSETITDMNGVVLTDGAWSTEIPTITEGQWLWTRTRTIYSDGQFTIVYTVSRSGENGAQGQPGVGYTAQNEQWYLSTSPNELAGGSWLDNEPSEIPDGKYLWGRIEYTMSDGSTRYSNAVYRSMISGLISKADEVEKKITQKVWASDIETYVDSSIEDYDGSIGTGKSIRDTVASTEIELGKISSSVKDISSELDETATELEERISTAEQAADGFRQTVEHNYAKLTDVGANNLYVIKNEVPGYIHSSHGTISNPSAAKEVTSAYIPVDTGSTYIIQSWATPTVAGKSWLAYQYYSDNQGTIVGTRVSKYGETTDSGVEVDSNGLEHLTYQITIPDGVTHIRVSYRHFDDGYAMVEKATTPSAYIMNPLDSQGYTDSAKSEIMQTANKISWLVQSGDSASNFTLTSRVAELISPQVVIKDPTGNSTVITGGNVQANTITAAMLATDAIKSRNYSQSENPNTSPYSGSGTFLDLANGNFWTPNFGVIQNPLGTNVPIGAWFNGTVYADAGHFGNGSAYWDIANFKDSNMNEYAGLVAENRAYIQAGNWQINNNFVSTRKYVTTSAQAGQLMYYKDTDTNTYYDVGMKIPGDFTGRTASDSEYDIYNKSFFYGRKYTGNSAPSDNSDQWNYFFRVDNEGNIYEHGQKLSELYAPISGDAGSNYVMTKGSNTIDGSLTVTTLTVTGTLTATASAASKVTSALSVNGKSFDGSAAVTVGTIGVGYGGTGATSFTAGTVLIGNGSNAIQTRAIRNNTAIGYLGWTGANVDNTLITTNTLAYWDGRFNNTSSNIRYVYQGKLGDIVTHNIDEFITTDGGSVTELTAGNLIVTSAGRFTNGLYGDLTGNITGGSTKVFDSGNGTATTFAYSKSGLTANWTATPWFAAWNGYELRAISVANVKTTLGLNNVENTADANKNVLSATKFTSAQSVTLTGDTTGTASSTAGWSVATTTKKLTSLGRLESANVDNTSADYKSKISYFYSSSSMTEGKPPIDGGILNFAWDSSRWGAQLAIKIDTTPHIYIRGSNNTSWDENWLTVLDSNNYNIYAPSKAGTGATGTWGISITGNAATATSATTADAATSITPTELTNQNLDDYRTVKKTLYYYALGSNNVSNNPANSKTTPDTNAGRQFGMVTYASAGGYVTQELASNGTKWIRFYDGSSNSWSSWNKFLTSGNYTDYTVTKTGTGASGTWGISVTGSAGTAGSLTTGRDFTIGKTKKTAVKWDGAVTFTQAEISDCATDGANGWMSKEDKAKLDSITVSDIGTVGADTIRGATNGGINVTISSGIATIKHTNQLTAGGTAQGTANNTILTNGGSFTVPTITYDINGHITATGTNKLTLPSITTITGNAGTATKFASAQAVTLTGDTTGTASSQAGWSVATTTKKITSLGRLASADIQNSTQLSKVTFALASSSMTTHKPPAGDGYILTFGWDNGGWGSQFYVQHTKTPQAMIRGAAGATIDGVANSSDWGKWQYLLDSHNYNTYAPKLDGTGATGTWDIGISGNATTATTATTATKLSTSAGSWGTPVYFNNGVPEKTTYLSLQPEDTESVILPFLFNDLAYLDERGGSYEMYSTTATSFTPLSIDKTPISINLTNAFDGSPTYASINRPQTETTVIDITCPQTFRYTDTFYIDFGSANWRAKNIQLLVYNSATESTYVSKGSIANNVFGHWMVKFGHNSTNSSGTQVSGFNRIRIVLSGWAINAQNRIAQIGIVNYGSQGSRITHMSRGMDDPIYRSITPNTDNTYDLGTSSKKWSNVYATKFTGNLTGNADTATTATSATKATNADYLANHVVDATTINNTAGTFSFAGSGAPWTGLDWVGLQVGSSNDKWQLIANNGVLQWRQNDSGSSDTANWNTWKTLFDNSNYSNYAVPKTGGEFTGAVTGTSFAATGYIATNSGNSGSAGGLALYGADPTAYGIAMRQTSNGGKHGHVQGDWAIYSYMNGADGRGWILKNSAKNMTVASVDNTGNAAFNGDVSIGTSGTNINGSCSLVINKTLGCLDFVFN